MLLIYHGLKNWNSNYFGTIITSQIRLGQAISLDITNQKS